MDSDEHIQVGLDLRTHDLFDGKEVNINDEFAEQAGDKRTKVKDVNVHPYDCVGYIIAQIYIQGIKIEFYGTGYLINSRAVITTAHTIYSRKYSSCAKKVYFITHSKNARGQKISAQAFFPEEFKKDPMMKIDNDYCLLKLCKDVHRQKYIEFYPGQWPQFLTEARVIGFPCDKARRDLKNCLIVHFRMWENVGMCTVDYEKVKIESQMFTTAGMSGGPLLIYNANKKRYYAFGIHVGFYKKVAIGVYLGQQIQATIRSWEKSNQMRKQRSEIKTLKMFHESKGKEKPIKKFQTNLNDEKLNNSKVSNLRTSKYQLRTTFDCYGIKFFQIENSLATMIMENKNKNKDVKLGVTLFGATAISKKPINSFNILHKGETKLAVGLVDSAYKNLLHCDEANIVYFWSHGRVWEGGGAGSLKQPSPDCSYDSGDIITIEVEVETGIVSWKIFRKYEFQTSSEKLKDFQIKWVPFIYFATAGQKVELV